jgi:gamma-glutamyltranspeptidase/glutathione hydrolase
MMTEAENRAETRPENWPEYRVENWTVAKSVARGRGGMVVSQHAVAAAIGARILRDGGNAIDASIAAAFALQAVEPWMSGLAACGFGLLAEPGHPPISIDFSGQAPGTIDPALFVPDPDGKLTFLGMAQSAEGRNVAGAGSVVVPGIVAGLAALHSEGASESWTRLMEPAIDRLRAGLTVDWHTTLAIALAAGPLATDPGCRDLFLPDGWPPQTGSVLDFGVQADTLATLAKDGPDAFYNGPIGTAWVDDLAASGSTIQRSDLAGYRSRRTVAALADRLDHQIVLPPDNSGSRRLAAALRSVELAQTEPDRPGPQFYAAIVEALRGANESHAARLRTPPGDGGSTTHLNVVDADGRVVALTFTLLNRFGAKHRSSATGILGNDGMAWFDILPGSRRTLAPGAWAQSNMCPIIAMRDGVPVASFGASGGNQIVPALTQVAAFALGYGMDAGAAIHQPRINVAPTGAITADCGLQTEIVQRLGDFGPVSLSQRTVFPRPFASPSAIVRADDGVWTGCPDISYPQAAAVSGRPIQMSQ